MAEQTTHAHQDMNIGDVVFFRGDARNPVDALIMERTASPWVHVGIVLPYGLMISARTDGVKIEPLPRSVIAAVADTGAELPQLEMGLSWVLQRAGESYGFGDILNQCILWLNAHTPAWVDLPTFSRARHRDCSHLVLDFLRVAGFPFSAAAQARLLQPERVTPGDLAAVLYPVEVQTSAAA